MSEPATPMPAPSDDMVRSLASANPLLEMLAALGDVVIWRHDLATQRIQYNDLGYKHLGVPYSAEGVPVAAVRDLIHPDDRARVVASAEQSLMTGQTHDVEARYRRADGQWRWLLVRRVVERGPGGEPLAFVGVSLDVTERVEQVRRAEQLADRLDAAARAARIGIWTITIGTPKTEWNEQMYELFDRVGDAQPPTLAAWLSGCVHPDDVRRVDTAVRRYMRAKQGAFEIEFRVRRRSGQTRWMVLRADIDRGSPDQAQVFGIAMDVTEQHEVRAALQAAGERAAFIARHAGIGTWESTHPDQPVHWDEQMFRLLGREPADHAPERADRLALVHPDDRARVVDANPDLSTSSQPLAYEYRARLPDGSWRWIASRSMPVRDELGQVVRRVGVNWDITESKNAELARAQAALAEHASRAKSEFLSRMSHELRTPLNAVLGFTQLLQVEAGRAPDAGMAVKLDHIRAAGEHLLALVNDALELSSLEAGTLTLELRPVPIERCVGAALARLGERATAHAVSVDTAALEGAALADPTRLQQVLDTLLANAIAHSPRGGRVRVESTLDEDGAEVRLRICDTGRGLDAQRLAHLFEPFSAPAADADGQAGTGIGLAIVKALVEGMGGRIGVASEVGDGTVFEITLAAAGGPAPARAARPHARRGQLLYIEDNSVNVLLVEELVKSLAGLQIACEATGAAGVASARRLCPDVILVDMQLPDFDGYEVLRQLRAQPETARTPCIALSANAMPEDIARGLSSGFDDYWTKPIKFRPFLDALERLFPPSP